MLAQQLVLQTLEGEDRETIKSRNVRVRKNRTLRLERGLLRDEQQQRTRLLSLQRGTDRIDAIARFSGPAATQNKLNVSRCSRHGNHAGEHARLSPVAIRTTRRRRGADKLIASDAGCSLEQPAAALSSEND